MKKRVISTTRSFCGTSSHGVEQTVYLPETVAGQELGRLFSTVSASQRSTLLSEIVHSSVLLTREDLKGFPHLMLTLIFRALDAQMSSRTSKSATVLDVSAKLVLTPRLAQVLSSDNSVLRLELMQELSRHLPRPSHRARIQFREVGRRAKSVASRSKTSTSKSRRSAKR